ncbi:MAG: hypothetical protein E3J78_02355, partial [Candidatus Cloacimonadota bacterium]
MNKTEYRAVFDSIQQSLFLYRKRRIISSALFYLFVSLSIFLGALFSFFLLDYIFYAGNSLLFIARVILVVFPPVTIFLLAGEILRIRSIHSIVSNFEKAFPLFKGRLFGATECSPHDPLFSQDLVYANVYDADRILRSLPPVPILTPRHDKVFRVFYVLFIIALLCVNLFPSVSGSAFSRLLSGRNLLPSCFAVAPGNSFVEKGKDLEVTLETFFGRIKKPRIILEKSEIVLHRESRNLFRGKIMTIDTSCVYHLAFSDTFSPLYAIHVVEHPYLEDIRFTLHYPSYTQEGDYETDEFDLYALKGTKIEFIAMSTQSLKRAQLVYDDSTKTELQVDNKQITGSFTVEVTRSFTIELLSQQGLRNSETSLFRIFSFDDEYPSIEIISPGEDMDLPEELAVDLVISAHDDYGIGKILLVWEKENEKHSVVVTSNGKKRSGEYEFRWDLMSMPLFPGDTLRYYAIVYDNDVVSGPKSGRTKIYTIRFPTAEEIYKEVAGGGEKVQESFKTGSNELEKLKEGLKDLERSLRESRTLTWEEKKKVEEIIKREKELLENIDQAREEMKELTERIQDAFLSNPEIREKLKEIERLMREIETKEIKKHMDELKKALEKMDRSAMLKAMEKMILSQEEIKKKLERTIEMLKRIAQEEKFEKIVKKAEELKEEQKRINEEIEGRSGEELKELLSCEKELESELGKLKEEMEDLAKELGSSDSTAQGSLEEASEIASELMKKMEQTQGMLSDGEKSQSLSLGQQNEEMLSEMTSVLSAGLSSMLSARRKNMEAAINALINDIILLSVESEKTMHGITARESKEDILARGDGIGDGISRIRKKIDVLQSKNPFISEIVNEELVRATRNIQTSTESLLKNNQSGAMLYAKRAMKSLNLAALELIESKKNLPSGGSGSMAQLLQQLQSLSSGQMQINQGTQTLIPLDISGGNIPGEMQRELQRLSELQSSLAERLRRIEEGIEGEGGDVLGDLGKIVEEMEEVAGELSRYSLDRELVERQERILSRMLDAQRSVHKREMSKKRQAEAPGEVTAKKPLPLRKIPGEKKGIRKDILRELEENNP